MGVVRDGVFRMLDAVRVGYAVVLRSAYGVAVAYPVNELAAGRLSFLSVRRVSARLRCAASAI
jgi:hypothetical protein